MTDPTPRPRLHPLLGTAAVAVIVTCAVGVYAMLRPATPVPTAVPVVATVATPASTALPPAPVASVPVAASVVVPATPASAASVGESTPVTPMAASSPPAVPKPRPRPHVVHHRPAPAPVVRSAPEDPALYDNLPGYNANAQPCASCGTVVSIQAINVDQPTTGVGGLGGAALGGLVGNQFGRGNGRTAMTVLGALGGAVAGNSVEHSMNRRVVYRMVVRFENGTSQAFTQEQPFPFGEGEGVRMINGVLYRR